MKLFFTASYSGREQLQSRYTLIVTHIQAQGIEVMSPELEKELYKDNNTPYNHNHYKFVKRGIAAADALIIESSHESFQLGHEATLALLLNKPVLIVSQTKDHGKRISYPKFVAKLYKNEEQLKSILDSFIEYVKDLQFTKFNFIISSDMNDYLSWKSASQAKAKSDIAREAIQRLIDEDESYRQYRKHRSMED